MIKNIGTLELLWRLGFIALMLWPFGLRAAVGDSICDNSIGLNVRPMWVIPTSPYLKYADHDDRIDAAVMSDLRWSFKFSRESRMGRTYPGTYQGVGLGVLTMMPTQSLGTPALLYVFQGSRLAGSSRGLSLNYEWNFGLSAGWDKYDEDKNPDNTAVGSHFNAYLNIGLMLRYRLSDHLVLNGGVEASHYSDGNSALPNSGVNMFGARIGLSYIFNPVKDPDYEGPEPEFDKHLSWDVMAYGAPNQQTVVNGYDEEVMVPHRYFVGGVTVMPLYRLSHKWSVGGSVDLQYDQGANLQSNIAEEYGGNEMKFYRQSFSERFSAGLALHAEFTMPIFSINIGLGRNIIAKGSNAIFYQTLALKSYVSRNAFINIGYSLRDFKKPNHLMLGAGWSFGR